MKFDHSPQNSKLKRTIKYGGRSVGFSQVDKKRGPDATEKKSLKIQNLVINLYFIMESVAKMKRLVPDQFHCLVKMHLSFLLDLTFDDCDCSFLYDSEALTTPTKKKSFFTPKKKVTGTNGVMDGAPLTQVS